MSHASRAGRGGAGSRTRGARRALLTGLFAAGTARAAYTAAVARPPGGAHIWARTNHRGEPVTLLEGPAVAAGAAAAAAVAAGTPARARAAAVLATGSACAFGGYDDLAGSGDRRGFRGHLGALREGELTTGAVKLGGIGLTGAASAVVLGGPPADVAINAGLIAASANLVNLFDLRPGRAIKVALLAAGLLGAPVRPQAAAVAGSAGALLPADLGERAMLGDAGANALGALLGVTAAASLPRGARLALFGVIASLTAASEVISFTKVIERTPPLHWLDMLGRRRQPSVPPADEAGAGGAARGSRSAANGQVMQRPGVTAGQPVRPRPPTTT